MRAASWCYKPSVAQSLASVLGGTLCRLPIAQRITAMHGLLRRCAGLHFVRGVENPSDILTKSARTRDHLHAGAGLVTLSPLFLSSGRSEKGDVDASPPIKVCFCRGKASPSWCIAPTLPWQTCTELCHRPVSSPFAPAPRPRMLVWRAGACLHAGSVNAVRDALQNC